MWLVWWCACHWCGGVACDWCGGVHVIGVVV